MRIGSGISQTACKTVVSARAKRAGMRLPLDVLDAILPLRTPVFNGSYDVYWHDRSYALT